MPTRDVEPVRNCICDLIMNSDLLSFQMRVRYDAYHRNAPKGTRVRTKSPALKKVWAYKSGQVHRDGGARGFCLGFRVASSGVPQGDITRGGRRIVLPMIDVERP